MLRLVLILLTATVCVLAGAVASVAAFAWVLYWPLSETNVRGSAWFGVGWGVAGAIGSLIALCLADRKYQVWVAVAAVLLTWLVAFVGISLYVASSLG